MDVFLPKTSSSINFNLFSDGARAVMGHARTLAKRMRSQDIRIEHVVIGMMLVEVGPLPRVIRALGIDPRTVCTRAEKRIRRGRKHSPIDELPFCRGVVNILERAAAIAQLDALSHLEGNPYIGAEHLFMSFLEESNGLGGLLFLEKEISADDVRKILRDHPLPESAKGGSAVAAQNGAYAETNELCTELRTLRETLTSALRNSTTALEQLDAFQKNLLTRVSSRKAKRRARK